MALRRSRGRSTDGAGTETLTAVDARHFAYDNSETILSCEPGAVPFWKPPRTGTVVVDE